MATVWWRKYFFNWIKLKLNWISRWASMNLWDVVWFLYEVHEHSLLQVQQSNNKTQLISNLGQQTQTTDTTFQNLNQVYCQVGFHTALVFWCITNTMCWLCSCCVRAAELAYRPDIDILIELDSLQCYQFTVWPTLVLHILALVLLDHHYTVRGSQEALNNNELLPPVL